MLRRRLLIGGGALALAGGATVAGWRSMGAMADYGRRVGAMRAPLAASPDVAELIRFAALAPNGHNTQPWRFHASGDGIEIRPDFSRRTPVVDPDDHHIFVSLGCAAETLSLAAAARGRPGEIRFNPAGDGGVDFLFGNGVTLDEDAALFEAIPRRQSSRGLYDGRPVDPAILRSLTGAAATPGVEVVLITDRPGMGRARDLILAGDTVQMNDPAFLRIPDHRGHGFHGMVGMISTRRWARFPRKVGAPGKGVMEAGPTV